jgi:formylglycine-generating enzyme required for sulfatase activity
LPAEAEWEYAAQDGVARRALRIIRKMFCLVFGQQHGTTNPVALKQANAFGL